MKYLIFIAFLVPFTIVQYSNAENLVNGGMSGGGGGTVKVQAIGYQLNSEVLKKSRRDLFMFFSRQTRVKQSLLMQRLFAGKKTIFDMIKTKRVYSADKGCVDSHGNSVDGSIVSPEPDTICINEKTLSRKLSRDGARNQVLALMTHEYAHLLGFNEADASAVQKEVFELTRTSSSSARIQDVFNYWRSKLATIRGAIINHRRIKSAEWNYLCYVSSKIISYFGDLRGATRLNKFSFYSSNEIQLHDAYFVKAQVLQYGTCFQSDYHPMRANFDLALETWFAKRSLISASEIASRWLVSPKVDPAINVTRIRSVRDFENELNDIWKYIELAYTNSLNLESKFRSSKFGVY